MKKTHGQLQQKSVHESHHFKQHRALLSHAGLTMQLCILADAPITPSGNVYHYTLFRE
nr:hypothetical protein [Clostridia bacterium]